MPSFFDEFIIVDETVITDLTLQNNCTIGCNSQFNVLTEFASLELTMVNRSRVLQIKDVTSHSTTSHSTCLPPQLAQIVSWKWEGGTQTIAHVMVLNRGRTIVLDSTHTSSLIIRILKKREVVENPCLPISSPDDDLTVHIGDRQVTLSASWLVAVSPVVERMLSVEMQEQQQRTLNLDGHDITMEQFKQFVECIARNAIHARIIPNPTNVICLLKLADYFQIDWLTERCGTHLINCVEIPLIERFHLIERYRINNLKNFFLHCLNVVRLRAFIKEHYQQLLTSISQQFWIQLTVRLCDNQ